MIVLLIAVSFLIGTIPTGLLIARYRGIVLRNVGSGNIGASNVLRAMGKEAALITLAGDILKGVVPVALARYAGFDEHRILYEGICGLAEYRVAVSIPRPASATRRRDSGLKEETKQRASRPCRSISSTTESFFLP